ncbi:GNAT family N-acetyltransferase [Spirosoma aureum]|uniref:GNAT family N-acetyltransferase n=1 Tax=Spirosoma aureum TaxID=2692134 RepID=A0A6G9AXY5_9BACT|nr:GNAT family N-acetyltransferase [Spirosoma aureum]QIP17053.1 GNAT family N-acetyltransferase [Spirosoma aureum]
MELEIYQTSGDEIQHFRVLFLQENNVQFVCNKCHQYGWADTCLFTVDGIRVGYGSVWGTDRREDRDTIFEFYIIPPFRGFANLLFPKFCLISEATFIESQSNDGLLSSILYEYTQTIHAEAILFDDHIITDLTVGGVIFRKRNTNDGMDDESPYVLELHNNIVVSGGLMLNYNMPFAAIYRQVNEPFRRRGLGSFMVQELKKEAYRMGRVPAARCSISNRISKATLVKAGLRVCGFRLKGTIVNP